MKFRDIPQFPQIYYRVDIFFAHIEDWIVDHVKDHNLNLNPDFQRGHVWTEEQQVKYMEYLLKNPTSGLELYFNHPGWTHSFKGEFVLVDGKQRLNAILRFLHSEIKAYGHYLKEYEDKPSNSITLSINIATLKTREDVLQWYLDFNAAGTPHSKREITRVRKLLEETRNGTTS